ncbi:MAG: AMP-binding protein [Proteobacteria bacterium]|nr:AMP-binding protein [Pseudomonadota bacterium]
MATASNLLFEPPETVSAPVPDSGAGTGEAAQYSDFPCSVAQERFWLLDRLEPGNPSYNVAVRWQLLGHIDAQILERAWREVIARHEVLRTRFLEVDGKPIQRVSPGSSFSLGVIDLTSLPETEAAEEGDRIGLIEARAPFDLGSGPLLRVVLLRYSAQKAIILVTSHQIVSDGWSIGVMAREMGHIYRALALDVASDHEPLAIQYGDYAQWQLEWLKQRGIAAENTYWTRQLAGVAPFEVIADRARPAVPTTNGAIASVVLPRDLTNRLQELTAETGVTMFAAAVSTLSAVLARYTGKSEIVIGTQVSDRDQVELEPMIGQFVNSLILRNRLEGDPRFTQLLERTSTTIAEALEHKNIPIEKLLGMVKAGRGGSNSPAVSINFIFQRTFIEDQDYGEFRLVDMPSLPAGAIYDLNFFMIERPAGWRFSCQYNTDQFEGATVNRLLSYIQATMASVVASPSRRLSELRLADPAELTPLLPRLQGPARTFPDTLTDLFIEHARNTGDATAVSFADQRLTYAQLDAEAARFARLLMEKGVAPGSRVGVRLPRSLDLAIAILGIWKAGATWVALDGVESDLADAKFVITTPEAGAAALAAATVITSVAGSPRDSGAPLPRVSVQSAAAVWFSSGTTKAAVELSHHAIVGSLTCVHEKIGGTRADVYLSAGPVSAPAIATELLMPLAFGARALFATAHQAATANDLRHLLKHSRVTTLFASFPRATELLAALAADVTIPKIIGDQKTLNARLRSHCKELWALHSYVETGGAVSARRVEGAYDLRLAGEPFANTRFHVLDETLRPPPLGGRGELYVAGNLGAVDESAPASEGLFTYATGDERTFRTGDHARLRADGTVELIDVHPAPEVESTDVATTAADSAPTDPETENRIRAIWADLLGADPATIEPASNFFEMGGHSLLAARMLTRVQAEFGRRITLTSLFRSPTVRGLARLVLTESREFDFRQMVRLQAEGSNLPLIAINNTGVYYLLAKRLGPQQPVTSLQLFDPAAKHDSLPETLEQIAAEYVKLIRRVHPEGPYLLAGWCVAGALAFEIARQLAAGGHAVGNVFLIDSWVPRYFTRLPWLRRVFGNYSLRWQLARADWRQFRAGHQTLQQFMDQRPSLGKLRRWLAPLWGAVSDAPVSEVAGAPEQYDRWLLEFLKSTTERYEPGTYPGRVTLLRSKGEPTGWFFDPLAGWGSFVKGGIELAMVDGNHFTMFQDPGATQMAERMGPMLAAAKRPS